MRCKTHLELTSPEFLAIEQRARWIPGTGGLGDAGQARQPMRQPAPVARAGCRRPRYPALGKESISTIGGCYRGIQHSGNSFPSQRPVNKLGSLAPLAIAIGRASDHNPAIFFARVQNLSEPLFKVRHAAACWLLAAGCRKSQKALDDWSGQADKLLCRLARYTNVFGLLLLHSC